MKTKNHKNLAETILLNYKKERKRLKRKTFFLKARLFFTIVLPFFLILLAVKTAQVYLRMSLRKAGAALKQTVAKPVKKAVRKPEFITPKPVTADPAQPVR